MEQFVKKCLYGELDSDRHLVTLFALALACHGKTYVELGVREGHTTEPILHAAKANNGHLWSVDLNKPSEYYPDSPHYSFCQQDTIDFLQSWPDDKTIDFIFIDDWHSYPHVRRQLELIDKHVSPNSIVLLHDLMYASEPFYHTDLTLLSGQWAEGGPYRAVAELDQQFWEFSTLPWHNGLTLLRKK